MRTQATMLLFLNITKNADTWQNEVPMNFLSSWSKSLKSQILKLFSRQSAFYQRLVLTVFTLCFVFFAIELPLK